MIVKKVNSQFKKIDFGYSLSQNSFWLEGWISSDHYNWNGISIYCGVLGWSSFKLGLVLGRENTLYLGLFCIGFDF
jgi:hypothetical protein